MPASLVIPPMSWPVGITTSAPVAYAGTDSHAQIAINSTTWATDDPAISITLAVEESLDGGTSWSLMGSMTTHPGIFSSRTGGLPQMRVDDPVSGARQIRGKVTIAGSPITFGLTIATS